jgi:ABC-2 type transport system ATP-binding protein
MLHLENLSVTYEKIRAVKNVSLAFEDGCITGLIGINGAGKSTLLKTCIGLVEGYKGVVRYEDKELRANRFWVKENCSMAPEDAELLPYLTGREFLLLMSAIRHTTNPENEADFLLDMLNLTDKKDELILNYSHGMRQKLSIAAALTGLPRYIIFDEALNGLDTLSLIRLRAYLRSLAEKERLLIISSHILPLVREWCDPIFIMHEGQIIRKTTRNELDALQRDQSIGFENLLLQLIGKQP